MFKSIMNFIRRLMAPKPGRCPKALDYNWSTQDGDGVRKHEATNTGSDPVAEMQAAVKPPKDEGEPHLVPDVKHVRKVKPAADAVTDVEPATKKKPAKKTTAKKTTAKKTVKAVAENKVDGAEKAAPATKKAPAKKTVVKTEKKVEAVKAEEAVPGDEKTKKPAVKKATAKKTTVKKTVAKKPVAKKVAAEVSETKKEDVKAVPVLSETVLAKPQEEKPVEVAMTQAKPVKVRKVSAKKTAAKKALAEKTEAPVETIKETKALVVVDTPAASVATTEAAQAEPKPTEK